MRKVSPGGTITTIAGIGIQPGFSGDGGPATSAQLNYPRGVAVDGQGNVYIADFGNNRVRKVSPGGTITTFAGSGPSGCCRAFSGDGGPATSARLSAPTGVAVDGKGNVYIADRDNRRVRKVSPGGTITTFAGTGVLGDSGDGGPATSAQLHSPTGVAVDGQGNVYIVDDASNRVRKVSPRRNDHDVRRDGRRRFFRGRRPGDLGATAPGGGGGGRAGKRLHRRLHPCARGELPRDDHGGRRRRPYSWGRWPRHLRAVEHPRWSGGGRAGERLHRRQEQPPCAQDPRLDIVGWEVGTDDTSGWLRADRRPLQERVYTVTYEGRDNAGNTTKCSTTARVAKR